MSEILLEMRGIAVAFAGMGEKKSVRDVSLSIAPGETVSIVGESGSGKSVSMRAVMGLLPDSAIVSGSARFMGQELIGAETQTLRRVRGSRIAMIFQDPLTALNPLLTIGDQVVEAIRIHNPDVSLRQGRERALKLLKDVAIPFPEKRLDQYPHEFSGGMRQRIVIAIAIANKPDLIIADEPTTALDVTVQAEILDLLRQLCRQNGAGLVLITHDLGVVAGMAERVYVMYAGSIVEAAAVDDIFDRPAHPYTRGLLGSLPNMDKHSRRLSDIGGSPPTANALPPGCAFHPRCAFAEAICAKEAPSLQSYAASQVACHLAGRLPSFGTEIETAC
ncbi:MAG: ABC transporter ATP-binding protein [Mesorhizobium sp.]|nr:ABC transporter ATP-binding protein [Mesorhizobium sp.]MCO5161793.1 ABC transporter ATP-binding protein [Mesorhizobium sp.]